MRATVGPGESATLSASILRGLSSTLPVELICTGPSGVTAPYSDMIATQVKSLTRTAG
jgi:hypothetical protein